MKNGEKAINSLSVKIFEENTIKREVASGNGKPLKYFTKHDLVNTRIRECKTIVLFKNNSLEEIMNLSINVGIIRDNIIDTSMIQLNSYKDYGVYFPNETYVTSNPLPHEWLEMFIVTICYIIEQSA